MKQAQSADGVMHEFPDDTPDAAVDRAMKNYATSNVDPMLPLAGSPAQEQAKDIGRGVVRGAVRGLEFSTTAVPNLLGELGPYFNTPEEEAQRQELGKVFDRRQEIGSPSSFVSKHVDRPISQPGQVAESIFEGAATAPLQPGGPLTKAVTTIGGGAGAHYGRRLADWAGIDPTIGGVVGGVVGGAGAGAGAQGQAARRARGLLPTGEANRRASKAAAAMMEDPQNRLVIDPTETSDFAAGLRFDADQAFFSPQRGAVALQAADQIERANGNIATIVGVHSRLGGVTPGEGADYAAAMFTREHIREWIGNLQQNQVVRGDPAFFSGLWQHHRDTWRIHSNLEEIDNALQSAEWRRMVSGQGTNLNTIRQEIRKILDNDTMARRYSPEALAEMRRLVEGDIARNALRRVSAFAPHSAVTSTPAIVSFATGHADLGAGIAASGFISHFFRHRLEEQSLNRLLDVIREGSPLFVQPAVGQRARLLGLGGRLGPYAGRAGVGGARGALQAGADSPLAAQPEPVAEEAPLAHPGL